MSRAEKAAPPPSRRGQLGRPNEAVKRAPQRAPTPKQAVMIPKVTGPECRVTEASTGNSTLKLMPKVATTSRSAQLSQAAGVLRVQRMPSVRLLSTLTAGPAPLEKSSPGRISSRLAMTARKLTALNAKQNPTPTPAIRPPATAGPATRAALNIEELSETALGSSRWPTISKTKACRAGVSMTCTVPLRAASRYTSQTVAVRLNASPASAAALTISALWVTTMVIRLLKRSTRGPPKRPSTVYGRYWKSASSPRARGEWVSSMISHAWAVFCTQVPVTDTS